METPANLMTPTKFCERIQSEFKGLENVEIFVRDQGALSRTPLRNSTDGDVARTAWAEEKGMRTFLSVARGTEEPCKFLEIHYKGSSSSNRASSGEFKPPLAFVGKGITFGALFFSSSPFSFRCVKKVTAERERS